MAMMVKTCPTASTAGERSPPRQFSYVSFRGSGRLAFQHLRYHLLLSGNAIPVGPRPSHRCYPVRRRSICHRLAAQSRSLGLYRFPCRSFLRSGFNRYCELNAGLKQTAPRRNLNHFSPRSRSRSSSMIFSSIAGVRLAASGFPTNQGIETSHANPNRLNQWYQTASFPRTFKGGPQDSRSQPEKRTRATLNNTI
jgi:hypothetical protein